MIVNTSVGHIVGPLPCREKDCFPQKLIVLENDQYLDMTLFRVEKGSKIIFQLGPSLFGKKISIYTNHPMSTEFTFVRQHYNLITWRKENMHMFSRCSQDWIEVATLQTHRAGAFHYYFCDIESNKRLGSGYFVVDPVLSFYGPEATLPLEAIKCQTVLSKCLGPFDQWEDRLRVSHKSGYNMIHFTPIQALGGSNSSYCLLDQLRLNPAFGIEGHEPESKVSKLTKKMKEEWKVLSIGDVVLNHTANESPWLWNNPDCSYNMITAPHLIPAAILDGYLHFFSKEVAQEKHVCYGIPKMVFTESHLTSIRHYLEGVLIKEIRLHEFYQADVEKLAEEFLQRARGSPPICETRDKTELRLINDSFFGRYQGRVDLRLAVQIFNIIWPEAQDEESRLMMCSDDLKNWLTELNIEKEREIENHLSVAIENCISHMRYTRVRNSGPGMRAVSEDNPLVPRYFTGEFFQRSSIEKEILENRQFVMAHNGWVIDWVPLKNFADPDSYVYLRRELIVWGDSVKLRYGNSRHDSPFLWDHMRKYVEMTVSIFEGIRLDNLHSTQLHVAEYLVDCAREIKPDLYVVAELFTNNEAIDNLFVNRLGITSLIREAMSAKECQELGRLINRYGGDPVGSFYTSKNSILRPCFPHALFFDITHDNPSPVEEKSVFDLIPTAALVSMTCCATGSSRGYDEMVPHQINVVDERRFYPSWTDGDVESNSVVNGNSGIIPVKRILNTIHEELARGLYDEVYVNQANEDVIEVTRRCRKTRESVILVAYTAFSQTAAFIRQNTECLEFPGVLTAILIEAHLKLKPGEELSSIADFQNDLTFINGLKNYEVVTKINISLNESDMLKEVPSKIENCSKLDFTNFVPGSIVIFRTRPHERLEWPLKKLDKTLQTFTDALFSQEINDLLVKLTHLDINYVLYRCSEEEKESGIEAYYIPGYGPLVYCGLQGVETVLQQIRLEKNIGHPLCENLRQGNWMMDYISGRLKARRSTLRLGCFFQDLFDTVRQQERHLIPCYFDIIVGSMYRMIRNRAAFLLTPFIDVMVPFVRELAMGTYICVGYQESAPLPAFCNNAMVPEDDRRLVTISAGLPHFSTGYMRSWGRDTFVSLRGLLLLTGRFSCASLQIVGYASCLRHGLIPNLLDRGTNARYNSRDAVWWWLYSIKCFVEEAPRGFEILKEKVSRLYPTDDSFPTCVEINVQPLEDVMQEALEVHFKGLAFRERNAGLVLDPHMTSEGFNNEIGVDVETGFVYGGNPFNCGTWMDKMGSDRKSGNKGKPATSRDGSAVELVGLCKAVVGFLASMNEKGFYPYGGVQRVDEEGNEITWTWKEWDDKICENFEKFFWIPETPSALETRPEFIYRREIYKDSVGASSPWTDYQFRCNFLVALVVAPELVDPKNAWSAIKKAEEILLGPLGIKTLDPADWNYNGYYNNDDDSGNFKVAGGFNYHQGPEWLWPVGYFLRAKIYFAKFRGAEETEKAITEVKSYLGRHCQEILDSPWCGLPELTNANGEYCEGSCRIQAWTMGSLYEVFYDLQKAVCD